MTILHGTAVKKRVLALEFLLNRDILDSFSEGRASPENKTGI